MSKEETSLEDLDPIFKQAYIQKDKEEAAAKKSDAKGDDKKSLVERAKQELNIPEADRYLYDLLGAYAGKRSAQAMDARFNRPLNPAAVFSAPPAPRIEPTMLPASNAQGMPRPVAGGPAGPVGGPASLIPTDPMHTRQLQGTTDAGATGRARQNTYNEATAQQSANRGAQKGVLSQLQKLGVVTQGADDILAKMPGMTSTPSGILVPSSAVYPTAPPAPPPPPPPPKPGPLSQIGGVLKQGAGAILNAPGVSGALGGLGMAESGQEFMKRRAAGDVPGQVLAGMGVAGGGLAMLPNPIAKALGAAISTASPLSLYLRDKIGAPSDASELTEQEKMMYSLPAFGIYPRTLPQPRLRPRTFAPGENNPPVESYR